MMGIERHDCLLRPGQLVSPAMKTWLCLAVLIGAPAQAGTLFCGTKVITESVSSGALLAACGDPTQIDRTWIFRAVAPGGPPNSVGVAMVKVHAGSGCTIFAQTS